jgi:hypothetical protein
MRVQIQAQLQQTQQLRDKELLQPQTLSQEMPNMVELVGVRLVQGR